MRIIKQNPKAVKAAVNVLQKGGLVIYPTETVYGIGADATDSRAVKKLNAYKKRAFGKPYSVAVSGRKMAEIYVKLNPTARNLYRQFLPGPITIVSDGKHRLAPGVESETGTLGIRIPKYKLVTDIVRKLERPVTATSANASYQKRPYKLTDIWQNISPKQRSLVDLAIDAGELPRNEPSTVIDTTPDNPVILRQGEIKLKGKNEILSRGEENTQNLAKELFQKYENYLGRRPLIFALEGDMGAGKTQFAKGLGKAMSIKEEIVSPTFNLVNTYTLSAMRYTLNHIDAWRLENSRELETLGFVKMIEDKNMVIAVEWADRVARVVKKCRDQAIIVWVKIKYPPAGGENERLISWGTL